jgi:hypothetical protein
MAEMRANHVATLLTDGRVLIVGCCDANAELYDPATGAFTPAGATAVVHGQGLTATRLPDGRVLIAGGDRTQAAEIYDPAAGTFILTGTLSVGRARHSATLLADGRVLLAGGLEVSLTWPEPPDYVHTLASAELYDPATGTFTPTGSLSEDRQLHAAARLPDGRVLVTGGERTLALNTGTCLTSTEIFDPGTGAFANTASMAEARCFPGDAAVLADGTVLVLGGAASAELYDSSAAAFITIGAPVWPRFGPRVSVLPDGRLVVSGGAAMYGDPPSVVGSVEIFDPTVRSFSEVAPMSAPRLAHTSTTLLNGQVLVTGGWYYPGDVVLASAEVFTAPPPPAPTSVTGTVSYSSTALAGLTVDLVQGQPTNPPLQTTTTDGEGHYLFEIVPAGRYHVKVHGPAGYVGWKSISIVVAGAPVVRDIDLPKTISLLTPANGTTVTGLPTLTWTSNPEAETGGGRGYTIQVNETSNWRLAETGTSALPSYVVHSPLIPGTSYTWQVDAYDAVGRHVGTTEFAFTFVMETPSPAGAWTLTGGMSEPRRDHTATRLDSGKVLIVGWTTRSAELYDPATGSFAPAGETNEFHSQGSSATLLGDGRVLIVGGGDGGSSAEIYDPGTGVFTRTGSLNVPRSYHSATLLSDGRVLIAAGQAAVQSLPSAEIYDPTTGAFTVTGSLAQHRSDHAAARLADGRVLVVGGTRTDPDRPGYGECVASAEIYNPATGSFSPTGSMAIGRCGLMWTGAPVLASGKVLVAGGAWSSAELYDPASGTFSATGSMLAERGTPSASALPDGRVLVAGGWDMGALDETPYIARTLDSAEIYDPATASFSAVASMNARRQQHTATVLSDGRVLAVGGVDHALGELISAELFSAPVAGDSRSVSGTVYYSTTPLAGVTLAIYDDPSRPPQTTVSDANGFYSFAHVAPGSYCVVAHGPVGYVELWCTPVHVAASAVVLDVYLPREMTIIGPWGTVLTPNPTLSWGSIPEAEMPGADGYAIEIRDLDGRAVETGWSHTPSYTVQTTLPAGRGYWWMVDAFDTNDHIVGATFADLYFHTPGYTPAPSYDWVSVGTFDRITAMLRFGRVLEPGVTTVTTSQTGPPPPSGFELGTPPTYYDFETTAGYLGPIEVCISYSGTSYGDESTLRLYHYVADANGNLQPVDITTTLDPIRDIICGTTPSLSAFAIVEPSPDRTPPTIGSVTATPSTLWPASHRMVNVALSVDAQDDIDGAPSCRITGVTSSEPEHGTGDGDTGPDMAVTGPLSVNLRAERSGKGPGRTYTVSVTCTDTSANAAVAKATVVVPHDRMRR